MKKTTFIIIINLIIFCSAIVALEFVSSLVIRTTGSNVVSSFLLNHTWKPNSEHEHHYLESFTHNYNSQGWIENYDVERKKAPDTYRIFYLGDSFTEGTTPMYNSVPSIVEKQLNELSKNRDLKFEVINTGTSSYSPTIFYVLFRYVLMDYSPDLIVINVDMTDDFDDWKYAQSVIKDSDGNISAVPPRNIYDSLYIDTKHGAVKATSINRVQLFLANRSSTYQLIAKIKGRYFKSNNNTGQDKPASDPDIYQRWSWCGNEWDKTTRENVKRTLDLLKTTVDFAKEQNVKIMLTSVPHYFQFKGSAAEKPIWSSRPHYEIARLADEAGVPYLNAFEMLSPAIEGTPQIKYYIENDMHFNDTGYRLWAQTHVDFITDKNNGLLPGGFY